MDKLLDNAMQKEKGATVFGYYVKDPERYGVVDFDDKGHAIHLEEKPSEQVIHFHFTVSQETGSNILTECDDFQYASKYSNLYYLPEVAKSVNASASSFVFDTASQLKSIDLILCNDLLSFDPSRDPNSSLLGLGRDSNKFNRGNVASPALISWPVFFPSFFSSPTRSR